MDMRLRLLHEAAQEQPRSPWLIVLLFATVILFFGLFPAVLLDLIQPSAAMWATRFR
jgi:NADH:ubiquinone oxidoreductase subunit 4 (subunit M)